MSFKYAIPTSQGLITRTSKSREYAYVVVAGSRTDDSMRKDYEELSKLGPKDFYYSLIEGHTVESYLACPRKPIGLLGFTGRRDLAEKLAAKWRGYYSNIEIVEIKPEHVTETKKRKAT